MHDFTFLEPASAVEASHMLAVHGDESRLIAGGTALLLGMRQRMLAPSHLISLGKLDDMRRIEFDASEGMRIGALVRHAEIAESPLVTAHLPMLASMAGRVANPQVRNGGTIGGNLCYGDPATDPPSCLMVLGAQLVVVGPDGERYIDIHDFFVDYFQTALGAQEVLTHILVPPLPPDAEGSYTRFLRTAAEHRPLLNVALLARRDGALCKQIRIATGASTVTAIRLPQAEQFLEGQVVTDDVAAAAADLAVQDMSPISDSRGTAEYRSAMARVVIRRALGSLFGLSPV
jgi:carbon-monoxide dehydrogenase medium subunit